MPVILLVEDNPVALRMVEYILGRAGYTTLGAVRADEGLRLMMDNPVDLAIVDFELPDMSGVDLVRALHRQNPVLPVMMVTADGDPATYQQALAAGAAVFLNKPVSSVDLLAAISKLLSL